VVLGTAASGAVSADAVRLVADATQPATNLVMQGFSVYAQSQFSVEYEVEGTSAAPPFSIGIYGSPDGSQPADLLQTYDVSGSDLLVGSDAVTFAADRSGLSSNDLYLLAKLDAYDHRLVLRMPWTNRTQAFSLPRLARLAIY
jgi:hypothetical protein